MRTMQEKIMKALEAAAPTSMECVVIWKASNVGTVHVQRCDDFVTAVRVRFDFQDNSASLGIIPASNHVQTHYIDFNDPSTMPKRLGAFWAELHTAIKRGR